MAQMIALWSVVALAWGALSFLAFLKPFFALLWYVPHCILLWLDDRHRAASMKMRQAWPHKTTPHVKVIKHASTTGLQNWRLDCTEGRQLWTYEKGHKQSFFERYQVGLEKPSPVKPQSTPQAALDAGADFLKKLQDADGHWANDYSGPLFLLPGAVFAMFIVKNSRTEDLFTPERRSEMIRYILNTQNEDGGWGMHTEGHSIMFGSVLNYVALRLLGCRADNADATRAREWIRGNGGAQSIASWGKVWLAVLGLYGWDGVNPVPPEMWLLPDWCPISMGRVWCHSRIVTLPFGYLYGKRYQCANTHVLEELRGELYVQPFNSIAWSKHRSNVFAADVYVPHSGFYELGNVFLLMWERFGTRTTLGKRLRAAAIRESVKHINYDDESTNYICLGPVNKTLNMVITWLEAGCDINDAAVQKHIERLEDYMWMGPEGLRMAGYNGSQLWDTSFAAQALYATGEVVNRADWHESLRGAHAYIDVAQVREDPPNRLEFYRSPTKGCWNFSTRAQSWQVSDCTAEGLRVVLQLNKTGIVPRESRFEIQRIYDAIDEILALRSTEYGTGGWASYEEIRAPRYMELLNCAEVYKDIMIEYEYTECTSSCVQSLCLFRRDFPDYRRAEVDEAIKAGVRVLKAKQLSDGSWYGSWGVCFTYGAFFAVEGLLQAEEPHDSDVYRRNREFLMSKQNDDGGWGEDFNSCVTEVYVPNPDGSQVVNTAWAVMALIGPGWQGAGPAVRESIDRGVRFIMSRQLASGDWAQERISGVFNGNCAIHYASYKNNMPVWALAKYTECLRRYGELEATPAPAAAVTASSPIAIARKACKRRD